MMVYSPARVVGNEVKLMAGQNAVHGRLSVVEALSLLSTQAPCIASVTLRGELFQVVDISKAASVADDLESQSADTGAIVVSGCGNLVAYQKQSVMVVRKLSAGKIISMLHDEFAVGVKPVCDTGRLLYQHWVTQRPLRTTATELVSACVRLWVLSLNWQQLAVLINPAHENHLDSLQEIDRLMYENWVERFKHNFSAAWSDLGPLFQAEAIQRYLQAKPAVTIH